MAVLSSSVAAKITPLCISTPRSLTRTHRKFSPPPSPESTSASKSEKFSVSAKGSSPNAPFVEPSKTPEPPYNYALANPNGNTFVRLVQSTESSIERVIFDFRFLALLAVGGSLAGSLLCFLNGCVYIFDAYKVYWTSCVKGVHTGKMVLRLVEAIDVYLAGTVMLIFGMGLYGLFISNVPPDVPPSVDRALKGSSLFGMFALKERPKWMKISSLDELKTKVGHVIVMILLVKMFERSKMVTITTGMDLLSYSVCIFLSSASLYILHNLHKSDSD
ncbi:hypothetical protein PHJA_001384100 [Phtheirospermum japonicum]|uniref:Structural constituent of ribosome n=1 Tax=Phtheirospermum japonicum TaxID=374723 RepID=A0A830C0A0_9LAMI|nr:hypothetical protein PHJA_001384100 [Phtheirospermum japonicum]